MKRSWKSYTSCVAIVLALGALASPPVWAGFVFDLADAVGGGNGTLPGTGGAGNLAATAGVYTLYPANAFVDGTFVPNNAAGAIQITGSVLHTYDFDPQTGAGYYNPWINGNNLDTDPSGGPLPNFSGDPNNHSLMAAHANKGITFDLQAIRTATGTTPNLFTAIAGDSRPKAGGTISYWVFVDGVLAANRNSVTNSEDALFVPLSPTAQYLTLAISDSNNDINSDHGYFGDAFLRTASVWNGAGADGNWANGANWDGGVAPTSGTAAEVWINGDTNVGSVTPLNQNIANPMVINRIEVTGAGMTNAVNTGGQPLSFQANGTLLPTVHVSRNTAVTFSGNLNLAADTAITVDDGAASPDLTVSGQVTGAGTLAKYGAGTVVFNGTNGGFSGSVVVNAGTVVLDRQNNPPLGTNSSRTVTVNAGATLTATASGHNPFGTGTAPPLIIITGGTMNTSDYQHTTNLQMTGGTIQPTSAGTQVDGLDMRGSPSVVTTLASASQATISSKMTIRNAVTFDVAEGAAAVDLLMSGQIVGAGGFTKTGAGLMRLSGSNSFAGAVNVAAGTLQLGSGASLPPGATSVQVDGTLDLAGTSPAINGLTGSGTVDNTAAGRAILTVGANNAGGTFSGQIKNTAGPLSLTKTGAGTLTLSGTNTYSGNTTIGSGTLQVGANGAIPSGAGKGNVLVDGTLDVAGFSPTVNGLSGVGTVDNTAGNGVLTAGAGDASSVFYGTVKNSGGSLSLVKTGTGTLTLSGNNSYGGATTVTAGTLKMGAPSAGPAGGTTFWLDAANPATITESGGLVSKWADNSGNGLSAEASGAAQPTLVAGALNGLPVIDFGNWGSGKWMQWMSGGAATQLTDIRSVFWVFGSQGGGGHLLGHTSTSDYHRGPYVLDNSGFYGPGRSYSSPWGSAWTSANIRNGSTYLDGTLIDGTAVGLNGGYQLIENITAGNVSANNLANDRNIGGRQGGQRLGEVIIYNRPLTEAERLATEAYLMQKWYGAPAAGGLLPAGTALQIQGGATFDLNGTNQTVASLADYGGSGGTVTNSGLADSVLTVNGTAATTFSGLLQNGATNKLALVKDGAGTLTLTNTSSHTGGTTVSGGVLFLQGPNNGLSTVGTGTLTVNANGAVTALSHNVFGHTNDANIPHIVINGGTLTPAQYLHVKTIEMTGGTIAAGSSSGGDGLDWRHGANTLSTHASANTATVAAKMSLNLPFTASVEDGAADADLLISGQIVGGNSLTKTGAGTLVLSGNNTYTGLTTISAGTLALGGTATYSGKFTGGGELVKQGAGAVTLRGGNGGLTGNVTVNGGTLVVDNQNDPSLGRYAARMITINPGATLTATPAGHNPFGTLAEPPLVIINGGTMNSSDYQHMQSFEMTGGLIQPANPAGEGGASGLDMRNGPTVTIRASAGGSTIASKMTLSSTTTFSVEEGAAANDLTLSGSLAGNQELVKNGAGTMLMTRTNAGWSGNLKIDQGKVVFGASEIIGDGAGLHNNWAGGGTLDLNGNNETVARLGGNPTLTNSAATLSTFTTAGGNWDYGGQITGNLAIRKIGPNWQRFTSASTYTGGTTVDEGILYLRGPNNGISTVGTGTLTINANGAVVAESHNVFGHTNDANIPHIVINGGTLTPAQYLHVKTIEMTGGTIAAGSSSGGDGLDWRHGANTLTAHASANTATVAAKMSLNLPFTASVEDGAAGVDLLISGQVVGGNRLTKTGAGTLSLTGANTYSGGTTVNAGTLLVNNTAGSATGTGAVNVTAGKLGGNGMMTGPVTVGDNVGIADSVLSPGNSIGTLFTGPLTFNSDGVFDLEIDTGIPAADRVVVNGGLTINSATLLLSDLGPDSLVPLGTTLTVIDYSGSWNGGTFLGYPDDSAFWFGANRFVINYNGGPGFSDVILTAVPEPSALALLGLGLAGLLGYLWRRRARG